MREMSADRPDKTDSPFTVDAGHFQVEMDLANLTYDGRDSSGTNGPLTSVEVAPMNLKVGLLNNLDFQLLYTSYRWERTEDPQTGTTQRASGFDGITPRLKLNLVGNDGGFFALALIPFVKVPVVTGHVGIDSVEGGLAIPYAFDIPGWDVGLQSTIHFNRSKNGGGYIEEFDNSVSIGHSLFGPLSVAVEFFGSVSTEPGVGWVGTVDTWLTYQVNENLRFDGGVYIGLTGAAEDWHPFIGLTWRY